MAELSAPGSLLLAGEYAVLEEGGLGLALAVERRVVVSSRPAERLSIRGSWGPGAIEWPEDSREGALGWAVKATARLLAAEPGSLDRLPLRLLVDSSAFFSPDGGKLGFGSSAAVLVGVCAALLRHAGIGDEELRPLAFQAALAAHRGLQGGAGSGYDVAVSAFGGCGLFSGGRLPAFTQAPLPWLGGLFLIHAGREVRTPPSIERYRAWKRRHPLRARAFLRQSNRIVDALARSLTWEQAAPRLAEAASLGRGLGSEIGVPAEMRLEGGGPELPAGAVVKALGAGNEIGAALLPPGLPGPRGLPGLVLARRGLAWSD